jgi:sigma-B regulation protein RsbU (phosphoserine phosphatase)
VLGVGLTFGSLRVLVRPLRELAEASESVGKGDLGVAVPVRSGDEVGRLASNFNGMVKGLKEAEAAKLEQGRIEGELQLARSIQADLLPARPPYIRGLNVAFNCMPAKELGGDFYDCIEVKGGCWGFLIADVSGKGVPAALHMANLRNLFRIFGPLHESPLETLKQVNAVAHADMKAEAFVTLVYAVVDPRTLAVRMVNAGHDPAYWLKGGKIEAFDSTAPPVGLAPASDYDQDATETSFTLGKGDMLFTFTDGVTEAMNHAGEQFSLNRLKAALLEGGDALLATERLLKAVQAHAAGAEQSDDITMLAVKAG